MADYRYGHRPIVKGNVVWLLGTVILFVIWIYFVTNWDVVGWNLGCCIKTESMTVGGQSVDLPVRYRPIFIDLALLIPAVFFLGTYVVTYKKDTR